MLNLFPQFLNYSFFAPFVLRVAVAFVFFFLGSLHVRYRADVARELSLFNHQIARWAAHAFGVIEYVIAVALLFGFETQLAALFGLVVCLKVVLIKRGLRHISPLSHLTYVLVMVVCVSLLMTGAGAFALDVRL